MSKLATNSDYFYRTKQFEFCVIYYLKTSSFYSSSVCLKPRLHISKIYSNRQSFSELILTSWMETVQDSLVIDSFDWWSVYWLIWLLLSFLRRNLRLITLLALFASIDIRNNSFSVSDIFCLNWFYTKIFFSRILRRTSNFEKIYSFIGYKTEGILVFIKNQEYDVYFLGRETKFVLRFCLCWRYEI